MTEGLIPPNPAAPDINNKLSKYLETDYQQQQIIIFEAQEGLIPP